MTSSVWITTVSGSIPFSLFLAATEAADGAADAAFAVHQGAAAVRTARAPQATNSMHRSFTSAHTFFIETQYQNARSLSRGFENKFSNGTMKAPVVDLLRAG
jgi:hypothetical protein